MLKMVDWAAALEMIANKQAASSADLVILW